jgi:hypothetical protein
MEAYTDQYKNRWATDVKCPMTKREGGIECNDQLSEVL